jgi:hypothetical protein
MMHMAYGIYFICDKRQEEENNKNNDIGAADYRGSGAAARQLPAPRFPGKWISPCGPRPRAAGAGVGNRIGIGIVHC